MIRHLLAIVLLVVAWTIGAPAVAAPTSAPSDLSAVPLSTLDGGALPYESLRGKVVLVVNVASFCSYTPQYAGLQSLYERFRARGFVVLGVPCNQFAGQEPGTSQEIASFCSTRYGVAFPMLVKQDVNGATRSPLYRFLVTSPAGGGRDIGWNFEKFLIGRDGRVIGRFGSHVVPLDATLVAAIDLALSAPAP